jgi:hypothetical protein
VADHDDLQDALRRLGRQLDVPPAPSPADIATAVRTRLPSMPPPRRPPVPRSPILRSPVLRYAAALLILLVTGVIIAVPPVRAAVLEFFRIGGVEIHQGPGPALPTSPTLPRQTIDDLAEAQRLTGLRVTVPDQLGPPDDIVVIERRVVSLVYRPTADHPAVQLDVFNGRLDPLFAKYLRVEGIRQVDLGGTAGWLIPGPHEVIYIDDEGRQRRESARLATNTLIWQRDGATYRLEADLPPDQLATIAASLPG